MTGGTKREDADFVIVWGGFGREAGGIVWRGCRSLSEGMKAAMGTGEGMGIWGKGVWRGET